MDTGTIVIVDPNSGEVARETGVQSLAAHIDPTGRRALTQASREGGAERGILDLQTWEVSPLDPQLEAEGYWTPDGDEVVMPIGREVIRFDTDGAVIERSEIPGTSLIQSAPSFAPNGESFAVLTDAGVEFYSYPGFEPLAGPVEVPADVTSISSLDEQRVAVLSPDGVVRIIGTDAGTPIERRVGFGRFNDTLFMVNPDYGQVWLAEGPSQPVRLATMEAIDLAAFGLPEQAGRWPVGTEHWLNIEEVDGQFELQVYDATGALRTELRAGDSETRLVLTGWDADAAHVALGMEPEDGLATRLQLVRFDAVSGTPELGLVIDLDEHAQRPREGSAGFWILDLSGETTIWSWNGTELGAWDGLDDITLTALSPGGTRLASVEHDGTVVVWDVATGTRERDLTAASALEVPLFVDDERLMVRDWWGRVRLWDVEFGHRARCAVTRARRHADRIDARRDRRLHAGAQL